MIVASATEPSIMAPPAVIEALLSAEELTTRIARCVGIWETNRGGDNPAPRESALDTVAGVHASMATIEQATMPYAVDALQASQALRDKADPPLTTGELKDAEARCVAVAALVKSVAAATVDGMSPADFIAREAADIAAAGVSNDEVATMFRAVKLKARIEGLHADVEAQRMTLDQAVASVPDPERMGLGGGSLKAYIRKPINWGENRAGWQRKAVAAMPGNVGARIEAVAESSGGTALAMPVIRRRLDAQLGRTPEPSTEQIVRRVAEQNNPNEPNYGKNVWETYRRLYA